MALNSWWIRAYSIVGFTTVLLFFTFLFRRYYSFTKQKKFSIYYVNVDSLTLIDYFFILFINDDNGQLIYCWLNVFLSIALGRWFKDRSIWSTQNNLTIYFEIEIFNELRSVMNESLRILVELNQKLNWKSKTVMNTQYTKRRL